MATMVNGVYPVVIGGNISSTDEIVSIWKGASLPISDGITQAHFPLGHHDEENAEVEIIDPRCTFRERDGVELLEHAGLERPTYEHALRFAEQWVIKQLGSAHEFRKPIIVFLHKPWKNPVGTPCVICVDRETGQLFLGFAGYCTFSDHCDLAGVRPRK